MAHSNVSTAPRSLRARVTLPTTVGLDLSDRVSHYHVLEGDGSSLTSGKVLTQQREALAKLFQQWKGCRLVIEAGGHSPWISRLAAECGMEVVVANPRRVELISKSDRKNDRTDAWMLAELGRSNVKLLAPIQHRSKETQADLSVRHARDAAVRVRTLLVNHVRGSLKSFGSRAPSCSPECFGSRAEASIPSELAAALMPILAVIEATNVGIKKFDKQLERLGQTRYPITKSLRRIGGVGPIVSLSYALTLENPGRFNRGRQVGAYLGMVPRQKSSGDSNPQMHITKAGDREMRRLLVQSANYILGRFGKDCDLRRFGMKIAGEGGDKIAKKRARIAVARKLAVLMHHLWKTGAEYDPFYLAKKRGEPLPA